MASNSANISRQIEFARENDSQSILDTSLHPSPDPAGNNISIGTTNPDVLTSSPTARSSTPLSLIPQTDSSNINTSDTQSTSIELENLTTALTGQSANIAVSLQDPILTSANDLGPSALLVQDNVTDQTVPLSLPAPSPTAGRRLITEWKGWKSWKTKPPWLIFLLLITLSFISIIVTLDVISRKNSGFVRLSNPPSIFTRDPELERAIWSQGVLYTAVPAFIMTIYRTMWEAAVTSFADQQPYIELKKSGGGPAQTTILLDYRSQPYFMSCILAVRNKHFLLAACMFSSVVLALLVVPLASFLFTTAPFSSNATFPLLFQTELSMDGIIGNYPNYPDLRLSLDSAAAMHIQDARRPPWTDGEYAFTEFVPLTDVGTGNVTVDTTAYSIQSNCVHFSQSQYEMTSLTPDQTAIPALTLSITAIDRGCMISNDINIAFDNGPPGDIIRVWGTSSCGANAGWSRFSVLTASYKNESLGITDLNLMSCAPTYQLTIGALNATTDSTSTSPPILRSFVPINSSIIRLPDPVWEFFENGIHDPGCYDPQSNVVSNSEFARYVYLISTLISSSPTNATENSTSSPLLPANIMAAAGALFSTTFAVFASTTLFQPTENPLNGNGIYQMSETRMIVVTPMAYVIVSILSVIAILNALLFLHVRQESILCEEPVGLLSVAALLHGSDVSKLAGEIVERDGYSGKILETIKGDGGLGMEKWFWDVETRRILGDGGGGHRPNDP